MGLTGKNASGKGEVSNYLKTKGFIYYSLSDVIREEATKRDLEHSRDNLINLGNDLRKNYGAEYLAKQINKKMKNTKKFSQKENFFVIDSIRSPYEVKELSKNKDFILVGIEAPIELRFKRLLERNRLGDAKSLEEFKQQEERENLKKETSQQLDETFKLAKIVMINECSLGDLHKKIENLLTELIK